MIDIRANSDNRGSFDEFSDFMEGSLTFGGPGSTWNVPITISCKENREGNTLKSKKEVLKEIDKLKEQLESEWEDSDKLKGELAGAQERIKRLSQENSVLAKENATLKSDNYVPTIALAIRTTLDTSELNEVLEWQRKHYGLKNLYIAQRLDEWCEIVSTCTKYKGCEDELLEKIITAVRVREKPNSCRERKAQRTQQKREEAFLKAYKSMPDNASSHRCGGSCSCTDKDAEIAELKKELKERGSAIGLKEFENACLDVQLESLKKKISAMAMVLEYHCTDIQGSPEAREHILKVCKIMRENGME